MQPTEPNQNTKNVTKNQSLLQNLAKELVCKYSLELKKVIYLHKPNNMKTL